MTKNNKQTEINYFRDWIYEQAIKSPSLQLTIDQIQERFFPEFYQTDVYLMVKEAVIDLRNITKGKIQFRYDKWGKVWRFFSGIKDNVQLQYQESQDIGARMNTQSIDYDLAKTRHPEIKSDIVIIKAPIITVSKLSIIDIRKEFEEKRDETN